jgi:hypothetical protein
MVDLGHPQLEVKVTAMKRGQLVEVLELVAVIRQRSRVLSSARVIQHDGKSLGSTLAGVELAGLDLRFDALFF